MRADAGSVGRPAFTGQAVRPEVHGFRYPCHSGEKPAEAADLEGTAWEPDTDYKDYQWWLARADGGERELVSWGY